jgi:hypothetical protein
LCRTWWKTGRRERRFRHKTCHLMMP